MCIKKISLVFFLATTLIGFYFTDSAHALQFADWSGNWFKVQVTETGKAGTVVTELNPDGGEVVTNNEKQTYVYLKIQRFELLAEPPYFEVGYCTFNGTVWLTQLYRYGSADEPLIWPVIGGEPTRFLTLFNMKRSQSQNITEEYWIPLEVKGTELNNEVGTINTASFKNIGGIFLEEIGTPVVVQRGVGSIKFTGSFIKTLNVEGVVPEGCRNSAP
jgi:hypothetical protein